MKCLNCEDCLKNKCDVYKSEQLKIAWNNLLNTIVRKLRVYKLLDWIAEKLDKKVR